VNKKNHAIKVLLEFFKNNKLWLGLLIFGGVFWATTFPAIPYLLGVIIDRIKNIAEPQKLLLGLILGPALAFVLINFLRTLNYYLIYISFSVCLPRAKGKIILDLFTHLGSKSYHYFESKYSGNLTNKITNAVNSIEPVVQTLLAIIFPQILALLIVGIVMSTVSPLFMTITWLWAVGMITYTYHTAKKGRTLSYEFASAGSVINGKIVDFVVNINNVICQATLPDEVHIVRPFVKNLVKKDNLMQRYLAKVRLVQGSMTALFVTLTMIGLIYGYQQKWVSVGAFAFIFTMLFQMLGLVHNLGVTILDFYKNIGRLREGLSLLSDPHEITDMAYAKPYSIKKGNIILKNVAFQYDSKNKLFEQLSLQVSHRKKIGLVGRSGAGKTTLIKLLMRLYDIQSGSIQIDGREVTHYTLASLRQQIALVPQDLTLFHRSIYENIAYGCGEVTKKQVIEVAKKSHCHEFIMGLPKKYQTQVGERGLKLSGGQRQRIAIARAMLKNSPILLLDEATSALDSETETKIQDALTHLMKDKTAVVVAHRLSTLQDMDEIVVLEDGCILEQGRQSELLAQQGKFYHLWKLQSNGFMGGDFGE